LKDLLHYYIEYASILLYIVSSCQLDMSIIKDTTYDFNVVVNVEIKIHC